MGHKGLIANRNLKILMLKMLNLLKILPKNTMFHKSHHVHFQLFCYVTVLNSYSLYICILWIHQCFDTTWKPAQHPGICWNTPAPAGGICPSNGPWHCRYSSKRLLLFSNMAVFHSLESGVLQHLTKFCNHTVGHNFTKKVLSPPLAWHRPVGAEHLSCIMIH